MNSICYVKVSMEAAIQNLHHSNVLPLTESNERHLQSNVWKSVGYLQSRDILISCPGSINE